VLPQAANGSPWATLIPIVIALLVMTAGLVCALRLELFTRTSRMLAEARAAGPTP
jgi:hypothetical protein